MDQTILNHDELFDFTNSQIYFAKEGVDYRGYYENLIGGIEHNSLGGKQGGQEDEYYHLTAAEYAGIGSISRVESDDTFNSLDFESVGEEGHAFLTLDGGNEFKINNGVSDVFTVDDTGNADISGILKIDNIKSKALAYTTLEDTRYLANKGALFLSPTANTHGEIIGIANGLKLEADRYLEARCWSGNLFSTHGFLNRPEIGAYNTNFGTNFHYTITAPSFTAIGENTTLGNDASFIGGLAIGTSASTVVGGNSILRGGKGSCSGTGDGTGGNVLIDGGIGSATGGGSSIHGNVVLASLRGNVYLHNVKSGISQANAGAAINEIWKTTAGHALGVADVLMIGV